MKFKIMSSVSKSIFIAEFKLNANAIQQYYGIYCYDYTGNGNEAISNDYLEIFGGYTNDQGLGKPVESAYFCGNFDDVNTAFPGFYSKFFRNFTTINEKLQAG